MFLAGSKVKKPLAGKPASDFRLLNPGYHKTKTGDFPFKVSCLYVAMHFFTLPFIFPADIRPAIRFFVYSYLLLSHLSP